MTTRAFVFCACCLSVLASCASDGATSRTAAAQTGSIPAAPADQPVPSSTAMPGPGSATAAGDGGHDRSRALPQPDPKAALPPAVSGPSGGQPNEYGKFPVTPAGLNAQTRSVADALKHKDHPERLSPLIAPKPFDRGAYARDSKPYLDVVEPGRVFQAAQPGAGVPKTTVEGEPLRNLVQGQSADLAVRAPAGMPVSFTSFDGGRFSNGLTAITVQADDSGLASVRFDATSGTINDVSILASCPVASGQAKFTVSVSKP